MKKLIGKTIRGVRVNEDESAMTFICDGGEVSFNAVGDCCSSSWFADLIGYQALVGHTVADVREVLLEEGKPPPGKMPTTPRLTAEGRTRQDCDSLYGYVLTTDAGRCTIAFRNSSNGYYGGWLEHTAKPWGRVWRDITDDWSA